MTTVTAPDVILLDGTTGLGRDVLGGKAFSIERIRSLDIPVPPAFALTTGVCRRYYAEGSVGVPIDVWPQVSAALAELEAVTGRTFGGGNRPLLVSVRSGAAISMPGMMDTVLNLGTTDQVQQALAHESGDAEFARDTRHRFTEQFTKVVGTPPPDDPWEQLRLAVTAVFDSWQSQRAVEYRARQGISGDGGTAVTVQAMVFGNLDENSGTGVLFTRNPLDGSQEPYGEWLRRGQGEDVVSGRANAKRLDDLALQMPQIHAELLTAARRLEAAGRDVQDIEFTVESGRLWLLQTRSAKRTPEAAVRHAVALAEDDLIARTEALDRITPAQIEAMQQPRIDPAQAATAIVLARGKPACPGIGIGRVVVTGDDAETHADDGEDVILARPTTDPDDVTAMSLSRAVLTEHGGSTSHAAVVCREMAVPCVVGCGEGSLSGLEGRIVTVDGATGLVYDGAMPVQIPSAATDPDLATLTRWAAEATAESGSLTTLLDAYHTGRGNAGR
ncbi:pyruvate, phosphate dikinase [Nocardia sp. NPDC059246]|uniref:pyruvate, phosphate dikinase n=1 Tax=unclassified Nocardia TaxID=2637762 RepID=UPI003684BB39